MLPQFLIDMFFISSEISSDFSCLLPAVSQSILFTQIQVCFFLGRWINFECCRVCPCDESCYDDVHVLCVDFLLQSQPLIALAESGPPASCTVKLKFLYFTVSTLKSIVGMVATTSPSFSSYCPCWTSASVLGCFRTCCWLQLSAWSQPFGSLCLLPALLFSPADGFALLACCWLCSSPLLFIISPDRRCSSRGPRALVASFSSSHYWLFWL